MTISSLSWVKFSASVEAVVCLQSEHKGFLSNHKQLREGHGKAAAAVKKNRKKGRSRTNSVDKQIKVLLFSDKS